MILCEREREKGTLHSVVSTAEKKETIEELEGGCELRKSDAAAV